MTWSIRYSDGSANAYRFEPAGEGGVFDYDPVRPQQSSTGMYSGGDPRTGTLAAPALEALWRHVRALEGATVLHVTDRMKGTGAFEISDEDGTRAFIIRRGPELAAFDAFVAALAP